MYSQAVQGDFFLQMLACHAWSGEAANQAASYAMCTCCVMQLACIRSGVNIWLALNASRFAGGSPDISSHLESKDIFTRANPLVIATDAGVCDLFDYNSSLAVWRCRQMFSHSGASMICAGTGCATDIIQSPAKVSRPEVAAHAQLGSQRCYNLYQLLCAVFHAGLFQAWQSIQAWQLRLAIKRPSCSTLLPSPSHPIQAQSLHYIETRAEVAVYLLPARPTIGYENGKLMAALRHDHGAGVLGCGAGQLIGCSKQAAMLEDFFLGEAALLFEKTAWWVSV